MFSLRSPRLTWTAATLTAATSATTAALTLSVVPVHAETRHFADSAGDMTSGQQVHPGDIEKVTVIHENRLRVTVRHHDLQPDAEIGANLFVDLDPDRRGPELVLTAGLFEGTDYYLTRARNWQAVGEHLTCFHSLDLDYAKSRSSFVFGRSCLGDVDEVRVALRVSGPSNEAVDWLQGRRAFTDCVSR